MLCAWLEDIEVERDCTFRTSSCRAANEEFLRAKGDNFARRFVERAFRFRGFVIHLQADPECVGHAEESGEAQARVGGNGAFAGDNLADAALRDGDFFGETVLSDFHGLEEFFEQDLAGMGVANFSNRLPSIFERPDIATPLRRRIHDVEKLVQKAIAFPGLREN